MKRAKKTKMVRIPSVAELRLRREEVLILKRLLWVKQRIIALSR